MSTTTPSRFNLCDPNGDSFAQRAWMVQSPRGEWVKWDDYERAMSERDQLRTLVRALFEQYLDVVEESDSGRAFRPTTIGTCRAQRVEPLGKLLLDLRAAVGLPPPEMLDTREEDAA